MHRFMRNLGVDNDTWIVVYATDPQHAFAFRTWITLCVFGHTNCCVLDGGLLNWKHLRYPTTNKSTYNNNNNKVNTQL